MDNTWYLNQQKMADVVCGDTFLCFVIIVDKVWVDKRSFPLASFVFCKTDHVMLLDELFCCLSHAAISTCRE